jgi:hypothetical protein
MIGEYSSVWAILSRLSDLVLWLISQLTATVNSINDHESRIVELELENEQPSPAFETLTESTTLTIQNNHQILFVDASSGEVHLNLDNPIIPRTPLVHIVCVSAANPNSITAPIRDAVGNRLSAIRFVNDGQGVTITWHSPSRSWFVVGTSFSGTLL